MSRRSASKLLATAVSSLLPTASRPTPCSAHARSHSRSLSSRSTSTSSSSSSSSKSKADERRVVTAPEDDDDYSAITDRIPERPVTVTEGAGYSLVILAGLGFGGATLFYTISELMATSPEQKVYNKALSEVRADGQVSVYLGAPLTAYGSNSISRTQRQQIPHRFYNDPGTGAQRVQVQFHVRGPSGHAIVTADASVSDNSFRFLYVDVDDTKGSSPLHRPMRITIHPSPFRSMQSQSLSPPSASFK